jgi:hypothetical protein
MLRSLHLTNMPEDFLKDYLNYNPNTFITSFTFLSTKPLTQRFFTDYLMHFANQTGLEKLHVDINKGLDRFEMEVLTKVISRNSSTLKSLFLNFEVVEF